MRHRLNLLHPNLTQHAYRLVATIGVYALGWYVLSPRVRRRVTLWRRLVPALVAYYWLSFRTMRFRARVTAVRQDRQRTLRQRKSFRKKYMKSTMFTCI